jgi:hypothetical protein
LLSLCVGYHPITQLLSLCVGYHPITDLGERKCLYMPQSFT